MHSTEITVKMSIPLCNCNRHFTFLPHKTLTNPSHPQIHNCHFPTPSFKSLRRRRTATSTAASEHQTLPQSAILRIAEKLRSLGYVEENSDDDKMEETRIISPNSPGEILVPLRTHLPKHRVGHTLDPSWSTPENPVPEPGSSNAIQRFHEVRSVALKEKEEERVRKKKEESAPSLAELTLPKEELRRLRSEGVGLRKKLKVGKAGITEGIVNGIHERWRRTELVKITCEDICRLNMKRTHDLLERKTGGLVIWRSGSNIILYRGADYKYPYFLAKRNLPNDSSSDESDLEIDQRTQSKQSSVTDSIESPSVSSSTRSSRPSLIQGVGVPDRVRFELPGEAQLAEEADALLEGLGPRYNDWWGYDPLPVDADLLPAVVTGYRRPFRLLPYGVKNILTNDEMTTLRRLCRPLPCHFVLGRNRKHQGLAAAIIKLWEKSEIAKIAVKRGVQNTNSELMAEELKWLTGGTLLSRDKDFIVFYRGKDFLPAAASSAIEERRKYEIDAGKTNLVDNLNTKEHELGENYGSEVEHNVENDQNRPGHSREMKAIEKTNTKLSMVLAKKARAEKLLAELEKEETRQPHEIDKEGITEEERYMLRKVGLRMKAFLLLGRRGVFDGTVENMHLHWKYRELVKICIGRRSIEEVHGVARTLEAESGGILVAVERVSKGYAIIIYRGKNYKRPALLRPETLLSKREAMKRSLEAQRRESLKLHVLELNRNIDGLTRRLSKNENSNDIRSTEDPKPGYVKDQDTNKNYRREDKIFFEVSRSDDQSYSEDTSNEEDQTNSSASTHIRPYIKVMESEDTFRKVNFEATTQKSIAEEKPAVVPFRNSQLSNKERLLLRRQALKMKKPPVLAVGKSNIVGGVAKAIKAHFEKHSLAIVNIKGRAKGTSIQEVIYNLEQATGAVLVSQEPSKVILYRGWGSGPETAKSRTSSGNREMMARPIISPELISAIRLECGLDSADEGKVPSTAATNDS